MFSLRFPCPVSEWIIRKMKPRNRNSINKLRTYNMQNLHSTQHTHTFTHIAYTTYYTTPFVITCFLNALPFHLGIYAHYIYSFVHYYLIYKSIISWPFSLLIILLLIFINHFTKLFSFTHIYIIINIAKKKILLLLYSFSYDKYIINTILYTSIIIIIIFYHLFTY